MACERIQLPEGQVAIICGLRRPKPKPCSHKGCQERSTKLCDWPVGDGHTCDKPLCDRHAVRVGEDTDYCRGHDAATIAGMAKLPPYLPVTLADIGHDADWLMSFHCLTCGHFVGPAWALLREKLGVDFRLAAMLPKLACEPCRTAGREWECVIVVHPTSAIGSKEEWEQRYQLRQGHEWEHYAGP